MSLLFRPLKLDHNLFDSTTVH